MRSSAASITNIAESDFGTHNGPMHCNIKGAELQCKLGSPESVLVLEWRSQFAGDRNNITPSHCR